MCPRPFCISLWVVKGQLCTWTPEQHQALKPQCTAPWLDIFLSAPNSWVNLSTIWKDLEVASFTASSDFVALTLFLATVLVYYI